MRKLLVLFTLVLTLTLTQGAWAFSVSLTPSTTNFNAGDAVSLDIGFVDSPAIGGYQMDIFFDPSALWFDSAASDSNLWDTGTPFAFDFLGDIFLLDLVNASLPSLSGTFDVATLNFTAIADGSTGFTYGNLQLSDPLGTGTAPVPEPSTWLLMAMGLVGLIGARKKLIKA